mgnify:CR=1 FL=1
MTQSVMMQGALLPLELTASLGSLGVEFQLLEDAIDDHLASVGHDVHQYSMGKKTKLFERYAADSDDENLIWVSERIDEVRLFRNKLFHAGFAGFLMSPLALYVGSSIEGAEIVQKAEIDKCFIRMHGLAGILGCYLTKHLERNTVEVSSLEACWESADPARWSEILK